MMAGAFVASCTGPGERIPVVSNSTAAWQQRLRRNVYVVLCSAVQCCAVLYGIVAVPWVTGMVNDSDLLPLAPREQTPLRPWSPSWGCLSGTVRGSGTKECEVQSYPAKRAPKLPAAPTGHLLCSSVQPGSRELLTDSPRNNDCSVLFLQHGAPDSV